MNILYLLQQLVNAISFGSILGLLAVGYTMIYGILGLINFAHGEIFMIGAFAAYAVTGVMGMPFLIGVFIALIASTIAGLLLERVVYRPIFEMNAPVITVFIASFAASLGLRYSFMMFLGDQPRSFPSPDYLNEVFLVGRVVINLRQIVIFVVTILIMALVTYFIRKTKLGTAMRAVSYDADTAEIMGIDSKTAVIMAFVIGSSLAAISAVSYGISFGTLNPSMGFQPGLKGFIAAVLGGIGNVPGAMIGGFLIGIGEVLFVALLPPSFSAMRPLFVWMLLLVILFLKPTGLFRPNVKFEGVWGE